MRRWLIGLIALAACSDLDGLATSTPAPDGGADGGPDVAASPNDAQASDAQRDADPDAGFCERNAGATFCADFDRGGPVSEGFNDAVLAPDGGRIELDPLEFFSPPASLYAVSPPYGTDANAPAPDSYLSRSIATAYGKRAHIELAVRVVSLDDKSVRVLFVEWKTVSDEPYRLYLELGNDATTVEESVGGGLVAHEAIQNRVVEGAWTRIAIDVSFEDRSLKMTANGLNVFGEPQTIGAAAKGGPIEIKIGAMSRFAANGADVSIDDVLLLAE